MQQKLATAAHKVAPGTGGAAITNPAYALAYNNAYAAAAGTPDQKHAAGIAALQAAAGDDTNDGVKITVNKLGQFQLENPTNEMADQALYMTTTGLTKPAQGTNNAAVNENVSLYKYHEST